MKKRYLFIIPVVTIIILALVLCNNTTKIRKLDKMVSGTWQSEVSFPDWKGYTDDTLAMNSMYSFDGVEDQGKLYFTVNKKVKSFDLFVNNKKININKLKNGIYEVDISKLTINGKNTIQVTNINPSIKDAIAVNIPYPSVINGNLKDVGLSEEPFKLIDSIIKSDINNGFTSAQLAVIKDGKLVYQNAWGSKKHL